MSKVVRVAVVGYGGMGGWHTKRLQEIPGVVELAGVYDIKPATRLLRTTVFMHTALLRSCLPTRPLML